MTGRPDRAVILAVDDDDAVRAVVVAVLSAEYEVIAVRSGAEALGVARTRHVNLVVLDVLMPEMDGLATLARLRELDQNLGVLMLTAVDTARGMRDALTLGAVDYLAKPFRCGDLRAAVRSAIGRRIPDAPAGPLLHVATDVGARASLAVLLTQRDGVEVRSTAPERLDAIAATPAVILLELEREQSLVEAVARRFEHVPIVVAADDPAALDVSRIPAVRAVVPRPLGVAAVVRAIGTVLATQPAAPTLAPVGPLAARVIQYAGAHYADASVEGAAEALAVSSRHLSREFGRDTGMRPREYFMRVRVQAAAYLLHETDLKLSAIAARVGLCDASHLTRLFQQYVGSNPGAVRAAS